LMKVKIMTLFQKQVPAKNWPFEKRFS